MSSDIDNNRRKGKAGEELAKMKYGIQGYSIERTRVDGAITFGLPLLQLNKSFGNIIILVKS